MGGLCVLLLMMFCVGWILCVFFLSMLIPLLIIYNGIVGVVCVILYFVLRKKSVFTKYSEGYKHILSSILKYGLLVYGSISLVFSIPIIDATYRMGYNLVSGSLFSIILGLIISIILGIIFIKNKLKLSLLDNFNNILNIIYSNIIYSLVLVLFTFIIKVDINSIIKSIFVILFYLIITIIFYILKLKLIKKRVQ